MKLTYRGVSYEYTAPTVDSSENCVTGTYRGVKTQYCNNRKPSMLRRTFDLIYRGAHAKTDVLAGAA